MYRELKASIIRAILEASLAYDPSNPSHETPDTSPAPFWWLLFNLEMLLFAPTKKDNRDGDSIRQCIQRRMTMLRKGNIDTLYKEAMTVSSWSDPSSRPNRPDNRAAQEACDNDSYRVGKQRVCNHAAIAPINNSNFSTSIQPLFPEHRTELQYDEPLPTVQKYEMPGDIIQSIKRLSRTTANGVHCDSIDSFIDLVNINNTDVNNDIRQLFNLIFKGHVPPIVQEYLGDTYLFCLFKDPEDPSKVRPITVPLAIRRILANHVSVVYRARAAQKLLPFNFAVGINGGMDFLIKAMQLSVEKHIIEPQSRLELPSRAAVFVDLKNMYPNISRIELVNIIQAEFPELLQLYRLLYDDPSKAHYRWEDGSWRTLDMNEGVGQGCPLSTLFATLVLNNVLLPLQQELNERAASRVADNDTGDDGYGSVTHIMALIDDTTAVVPLVDLDYFFSRLPQLARPRGGLISTSKTRIMTSCNGRSILPDLLVADRVLHDQVKATLETFSANADGTFEEVVTGFRLLGAPVGSTDFANEFFTQQVDRVIEEAHKLHQHVPDLHTRLKLFVQCTIQKLPHLLGNAIMHNLPDNYDGAHWEEWYGPLTQMIDIQIKSFLAKITGRDDVPDLALFLSQIPLAKGGLGIISPSCRAAPDFVITMAQAMRYASNGFSFSKDLESTNLHPSITDLFLLESNPHSLYLKRFYKLLPHIASIATGPKCPPEERVNHFLTKISPNSARGRIKHHCASGQLQSLYQHVLETCPEHLHHLSGLLQVQTSLPIIGMNRIVPSHRLKNWIFTYTILRKLRLPIFDITNLPTCWCKQVHDSYGDHCFSCTENTKTCPHHFIKDSWAEALQPVLASAGHIQHTSKLETEKSHLMEHDMESKPLDLSFMPDPDPSSSSHISCPFTNVGGDVTIASPVCPSQSHFHSVDVIESVAAKAEAHLQVVERKKYMRANKTGDDGVTIMGDVCMGDLVNGNNVMMAFAISPHGEFGPILLNFLFHYMPRVPMKPFKANRPYAQIMHDRSTTTPCPLGVITTACVNWKRNKDRLFYGHSHTMPTPKEFTLGKMGLGMVKGFAMHLRNCTKKVGSKPPKNRQLRGAATATIQENVPPGIDIDIIDLANEASL